MLGFVRNGRKIVKVYEGSPAGRNGKIMVGDEIVAINHNVVSDTDDVSSLLRNSGSSVIITFRKKGNYLFWVSVLNIKLDLYNNIMPGIIISVYMLQMFHW